MLRTLFYSLFNSTMCKGESVAWESEVGWEGPRGTDPPPPHLSLPDSPLYILWSVNFKSKFF